jgi:hypothetical protein
LTATPPEPPRDPWGPGFALPGGPPPEQDPWGAPPPQQPTYGAPPGDQYGGPQGGPYGSPDGQYGSPPGGPYGAPPGGQWGGQPGAPVPPPGWPGAPSAPGWQGGPPPPPPPPPGWPQQPTPGDWTAPGYGNWGHPRRNGFGTAALIIGLLAVPGILFIIPGFLLGVLALVFGLVGRGRAKANEADNGGVATAGALLGALSIVLSIAWLVAAYQINEREERQLQECLSSSEDRVVCEDRYDL